MNTLIDEGLTHIARVMRPALYGDLGGSYLPSAYWRQRLYQILDTTHLTNAQLRAAEQTERFVSNRHRIIQQSRKPGPYIYGVYDRGLRRLWPK